MKFIKKLWEASLFRGALFTLFIFVWNWLRNPNSTGVLVVALGVLFVVYSVYVVIKEKE